MRRDEANAPTHSESTIMVLKVFDVISSSPSRFQQPCFELEPPLLVYRPHLVDGAGGARPYGGARPVVVGRGGQLQSWPNRRARGEAGHTRGAAGHTSLGARSLVSTCGPAAPETTRSKPSAARTRCARNCARNPPSSWPAVCRRGSPEHSSAAEARWGATRTEASAPTIRVTSSNCS